jgi:hypothetical protein
MPATTASVDPEQLPDLNLERTLAVESFTLLSVSAVPKKIRIDLSWSGFVILKTYNGTVSSS